MSDLKFQKLTPTDDVDIKGYEEGFKFIFDNKDICNVAISGPYGSGKSSVLGTFEKKYEKDHEEKKFIHIYLAHFSNGEENENQASIVTDEKNTNIENFGKNSYAENTIEGKIINQLIQQIPVEDIPQTQFHVKREVEKPKYKCITGCIAFVLIALLYFIYGSEWNTWVSSINVNAIRTILNITTTHGFQFVFFVLAAVVFFKGIYNLLLIQANRNVLKKLSIQGNEIEIFSDTEDSYFDKYLNEVLYLLEQIKIDVIVFEDIDRFNDIQIFERLREINTLANIRRAHLKKSELKFFYLLRDDIFITKDRTKFFDYIMPVIPVVDGSNSYNKLKEYLTDAGLFDNLDDFYLREISLYIDDLRLVKNIVNEYVLFEYKLEGIELNHNKFFGLITYKNIFPKDYSDLQLRKGFVYTVFNNREEFIENNKRKLKENIEQLEEQIDSQDINKDKVDKELSALKTKIDDMDNYTIAQIIDGNPESEVFKVKAKTETGKCYSFEEIKENDYFALLKFLLTNGYIDETYNDYMTFFYENSLTANDKIFLRAVADRKIKDYGYQLDNVSLVLENINPSRFRQKEILNFDLIEYLLRTDAQREYLLPFVTQLKELKNYDFIVSFFNMNRERELFVLLLNELWSEFFSVVCKEQNQELKSIQKMYSLISLLNCDKTTIECVNKDGCLTTYISATPDYINFHLEEESANTLIEALKNLNVKFERIDSDISDADLLEKVYVNNLYVINAENLRMFMLIKYKEPDLALDFSQSLTIISSRTEESIFDYLKHNPEQTLSAILGIAEGKINDDENVVISVINNDEISQELRKKYLLRCSTKISNLTDIREKTFYKLIMENKMLVYSASNIFSYCNKIIWDDALEWFLNSSSETLDYKAVECLIGTNKKQFVNNAIKSESIDEKHFNDIAEQLGEKIQTFNFTGCQPRNVEILIEQKLIAMTKTNLDFIRKNYPTALSSFISTDFRTYTNIMGNSYKKSEVEEAFSCEEISVEDKLFFLNGKSDKFTVLHKDYPEELVEEILNNHRLDSDLPELYKQYNEYTPLVQNKIFDIAKSKISAIISSSYDIDFELLDKLLSSDNILLKTRISLAKKYIKDFDVDRRNRMIISLGGNDIAHALLPKKGKTVACTKNNQDILQMLWDEGIIDSFVEDDEKDKYKIIPSRKKQ